jgi:4-amino-4-deoxychorismate lyase
LRMLLARNGDRSFAITALQPLSLPAQVMLAPDMLDATQALLRYKTTYRPWYEKTSAWLCAHPKVFDLLFLNTRGELCEGSRSNVYLQLRGRWFTPPLASGCLPGVQRAELLAQGHVQERILTCSDLHQAQAIRVSNALRGWVDVCWREPADEEFEPSLSVTPAAKLR